MNTITVSMEKITFSGRIPGEDVVAVERAYQVMLKGKSIFSFTCTPSDLEEMTLGALYSRGYLQNARELRDFRVEDGEIFVTLAPSPEPPMEPWMGVQPMDLSLIAIADGLFQNADTLFARTGCAHSCSLVTGLNVQCSFEDIGRHNALDKVIGWALKHNCLQKGYCYIITSGRVSGDYMAKAIHAGFAGVISRAAVTSEAIRLAQTHGVPLYGFARGGKANCYFP